MSSWTRWAWLALTALAVPTPGVEAQSRFGMDAAVQSYTFDDPLHVGAERSELAWVGVDGRFPVGRRLWLEGSGGFGRGVLVSPDGSRLELSGPMAARLGVGLDAGGVVFRGEVGLPAPTPARSPGEARVAGVVGSGVLPFASPGWNGGGSVAGSLELLLASGATELRVAGGYRVHRGYQVLAGDGRTYTPGQEFHARVVVEAQAGRAGIVSARVGVGYREADRVDEVPLFQAGLRGEAVVSWAGPLGLHGSTFLYGGALVRMEGEQVGTSVGSFPGTSDAPARRTLLAGAELRLPVGSVVLTPRGEGRIFRASQPSCFRYLYGGTSVAFRCPGGRGWSLGGALGAEVGVGGTSSRPAVILAPRAGLRVGSVGDWVGDYSPDRRGSVPVEGRSSGLTGWELGLSVRLGGGR